MKPTSRETPVDRLGAGSTQAETRDEKPYESDHVTTWSAAVDEAPRRSWRSALLVVAAVSVAMVLLIAGIRVGKPHQPPLVEALFEDTFDGAAGSAPNASKWGEWSGCTYNATAYYGNIKCGQRAVLDGEGHLIIPATAQTGTSISTGSRFSFVYGTASAWMKMPSAVGYWPAFWTLNGDPTGKKQAPGGEIDVLETYTTWPGVYHRGTHNWNGGDLTWGSVGDPNCSKTELGSRFHKYSVRVEPERITFFFDDQQCGDIATKADGGGKPYQFGPDNQAGNWLLLTLAIGGADGQQEPVTQPGSLLVDRVEVDPL